MDIIINQIGKYIIDKINRCRAFFFEKSVRHLNTKLKKTMDKINIPIK